ncbi:MAG: hypothetical protein QXE98_05640 [Archaeoglobaceae archaeon]
MKVEEYKEWLKKNGNYEEEGALHVIDAILQHHLTSITTDYEVAVFPHYIHKTDKERLEFDLLIKITHGCKRRLNTLIGVEFKESNLQKATYQAIRRRDFVDYMYVATRNYPLYPEVLLPMVFFNIGWVVWWEDKAVMVLPSYETVRKYTLFLEEYCKSLVRSEVERAISRLDRWIVGDADD